MQFLGCDVALLGKRFLIFFLRIMISPWSPLKREVATIQQNVRNHFPSRRLQSLLRQPC